MTNTMPKNYFLIVLKDHTTGLHFENIEKVVKTEIGDVDKTFKDRALLVAKHGVFNVITMCSDKETEEEILEMFKGKDEE